jgi:hypothetical protein
MTNIEEEKLETGDIIGIVIGTIVGIGILILL